MNKNITIGIDAVRMWASDEATKLEQFIEENDHIMYSDLKKKLQAKIDVLKMVDEETFGNWKSKAHYIQRGKDLQ